MKNSVKIQNGHNWIDSQIQSVQGGTQNGRNWIDSRRQSLQVGIVSERWSIQSELRLIATESTVKDKLFKLELRVKDEVFKLELRVKYKTPVGVPNGRDWIDSQRQTIQVGIVREI